MPADSRRRADEVSTSQVQAELQRVSQSAPFLKSAQLQRLLHFLVEETLAGRAERLKEYVVGVEVFGRPGSFDPRIDSIVRVEARRLRFALDSHYGGEGRNDPIIIELPKGSYVPHFLPRSAVARNPADLPFRLGRKGILAGVICAVLLAAATVSWYTVKKSRHAPLAQGSKIVVLPFANLSDVQENEYFCFGLMDEITTRLAQTGDLQVVARTSAMQFKGGNDVPDLARRLGVDAVLEGSVRRFGEHVRVSAQLINGANGLHIWSEMYERPTAELLRVQNEIADAVTRAVCRQLSGESREAGHGVSYSQDADANLLYWKAAYMRAPMGRTNWRTDLVKSSEYLERAIQRDDKFARAHAALADVCVSLAWERGGGPVTRTFMERGRLAASRALELDDSLAEAHSALGTIQFFYDYDPTASGKSFLRALQADPNDGKARMWYAYALLMQQKFDEAISQARTARELDPLSYVSTTHLAVVNYFSRHYDEALNLVREALEVADTAPAHGLRGMIYAAEQKYDDAITEYRAGLRVVPTHSYIKGMLGHAFALSGRGDEARKLLGDAGLEFERGGLSDLKVAYIYAGLGDRDEMFRHLERDYSQRDPELPYINVDPVFDPVRDDPRFVAIIKKMGLSS